MPLMARRLSATPIIDGQHYARLGGNINGPSLIETPAWLPNRIARYYLYFAHHHGDHIRLAVADHLTGPWRLHPQGVLTLPETPFGHAET